MSDTTPLHELHDAEAEAAVLGACFLDNAALLVARGVIKSPAHFYVRAHQLVWAAMIALADLQTAIDPVTMAAQLERTGDLERIGGKAAISPLLDAVPTAANISHHAQIVRELWDRREIFGVGHALMRHAQDRALPTSEVIAKATSSLTPVAVGAAQSNFVNAKDRWWQTMDYLEALSQHRVPAGLTTGWPELDAKMGGGPVPGEMVSIVGVPSSGKTAFAINWASYAILDRGVTCGFVSAEMTMRQLMIRQLNMIADVRTEETRTGRFPDGAWGRMSRAGRELWSTDLLHIDETPSPSIEDVIAKCTLMKQRVPALQYIFVDYFQLMRQESRRTGDLESSELKAVAQGLLHIAKSLEVVTVALVQPNDKQIKERADKRPQLEDVQGSSAIRQASHFVLLVYRPKLYDPTAGDDFEVNIGKARETATGKVTLRWDGAHMRVTSDGREQLDEMRRRRNDIAPELALTREPTREPT